MKNTFSLSSTQVPQIFSTTGGIMGFITMLTTVQSITRPCVTFHNAVFMTRSCYPPVQDQRQSITPCQLPETEKLVQSHLLSVSENSYGHAIIHDKGPIEHSMVLVTSKSYGQPPRPDHVGFVVDTAAFGNALLQLCWFSQQYRTTSAPISFYHLSPEAK